MSVNFKKAYGWNPANSNYTEGNESIGTVYLTGGGYVNYPITGISPESQFGWQEMVWKKTPTRSASTFAFSNMDNTDVGLVARCEFNIRYLNYEEFVALRNIVARERHITARFFDVDSGEWITRDMYCTESSRQKLLTLKQSLVGVLDFSVKLVATNTDIDDRDYTITYNLNGATGNVPSSKVVKRGNQVILSDGSEMTAPVGKFLKYWVTKNGDNITGYYLPSQSTTIWKNLNLYAHWE